MKKMISLSFFNKQRMRDFLQLMRADKPIGTFLLLWPTTWALWLSGGEHLAEGWQFVGVDPHVVLVFLIGVFLMRSAGCVINDFADRDFDKHVERTKNRPLTSGRVTGFQALALFFVLVTMALLLVLTLNQTVRWHVLIAAIPALLVAIAYPFMKRFFVTPQLVLGIAFSFGIPMAFLAHGSGFGLGVVLLMLANVAWVIAYDTAYAMVDRDDDIAIGIQSSALFFGKKDRHIIGILQTLTILILALVGFWYNLNSYFYVLLMTSSVFFVYQQWLIKDRNREACFSAFLNNAWFGGFIFVAILLGSQ